MAISQREPLPPNGGVECRWGWQKSRFWANIWLHYVVSTLQPASCYQQDATRPRSRKLWHLSLVVSDRVCWWRETTTKCMTKSLNVTPKTTEQHLIVRSDKSVAFLSRVSTLTRDIYIAICPSVCLSVRDVPVLDENVLTYCHSFITV